MTLFPNKVTLRWSGFWEHSSEPTTDGEKILEKEPSEAQEGF